MNEQRLIRITPDIAVDERELDFEFVRAGGPGGQHVNKVSTAVQLRFAAAASPALPAELKQRLRRLAGGRMTAAGVLILEARSQRSQAQNRAAVVERFAALLKQASIRPRRRIATRATAGSRQRRLEAKKLRGVTKRLRRGEE